MSPTTTQRIQPVGPARQGLLPALLDNVRQFQLRRVRGLIGVQRQRLSMFSSRLQQVDSNLRAFQQRVEGQLRLTSLDVTTPSSPAPTPVTSPPQTATGLATQVGSTGATLQGTVNPQGQATTYHFNYGPTTSYGTSSPVPDASAGSAFGAQTVQQVLTGLQPGTTYHFQLVATNSGGVTLGADETFTTAAAAAPGAPSAATGLAVQIGATGATLQGTVNPQGQATTYHFNYGPTTAYGSSVPAPDASAGSGSDSQQVQQPVTGLNPGTTYHFQIVATNAGGTVLGADETFTTAAGAPATSAPQVATSLATQVGSTGATLQGTVNPGGQATSYHFVYGPTTAYGSTAPVPDAQAGAGTAAQQVQQPITGLTPGTTYHYQLVATNAGGVTFGADETFTTPAAAAPGAPLVATGLAAQVTTSGATLQATVNPQGQPTTYHFNYGPTNAYGSAAPAPDAQAGSGTSAQNVQQPITGLQPGTTYHFQIVATNASGTVNGADEVFTTPPSQASYTLPPPLPPHVEHPLFEIFDGIDAAELTRAGYPRASHVNELLEAEGVATLDLATMHQAFDRWLHDRFRQNRVTIAIAEPAERSEAERLVERRPVPRAVLYEIFESLPDEGFSKGEPRYPLVNPVRERTPSAYVPPTRDEIRAAYEDWLERGGE